MHDKLFAHQDAQEEGDLIQYARELGLDVDRFAEDLRRRTFARRVAEDVADADASLVTGTPTFFVNGLRHRGAFDLRSLTEAVEEARRRAAAERIVSRAAS